jgi:diguanylate cyclase (GGDEF)-like protein
MKSSLSMILFDVDDFGYWNSRLGAAACDDLLCQIAGRAARLLRSYDLLGRVGKDEFLVAMPGGSAESAMMLAERLRLEVFSLPFEVRGESVRLSACFGMSSSNGRSPLVVLREAEQALQLARTTGPEAIQFFGGSVDAAPPPDTLLLSSSEDELLTL